MVVEGRFPGAFLNASVVTVTLTSARIVNFNNLANLPAGSLLGTPATGGGTPTFYTNGAGTVFMSNAATPGALTAA